MRFVWVAGARPNFMKIAPIWRAMRAHNASTASGRLRFSPLLVHTGQHHGFAMSDVFFQELGLPKPDHHLGVSAGSHAEQIAQIMTKFEKVLAAVKPDAVGVVGDVNSTMACALATSKAYVLRRGRTPWLVHVEAGLRSGDRSMPEEVNRVVTDRLADCLLTSEPSGAENLHREGVPSDLIHFVGNVMIDSLLYSRTKDGGRAHLVEMALVEPDGRPRRYGVVTLHRPSNVDDPERLQKIWNVLERVAGRLPILFPMHPRTRERAKELGLSLGERESVWPIGERGIHVLEPAGYERFIALLSEARFVLTDSGGVQEESTMLGVPCLTLRDNTERPITVEVGTNTLIGADPVRVPESVDRILEGGGKKGALPPLWDGRAAERVVDVLARCAPPPDDGMESGSQ